MKTLKVPYTTWFTTLTPSFEKPFIELSKTYNPEDYPEYDNYNAIEVSRTKNIPKDYDGVMGVPISFIDNHNPKKFEIIKAFYDCYINGKKKYVRIFIRHK